MKSYRTAALFLIAAASAGCGWSDSDDVAPLVAPAAAAPESFPFSGTTWTRTAVPSADDWKELQMFFQQHPNYADSADFGEWRHGRRATAMTFAAATFSQKLGGYAVKESRAGSFDLSA